MSEGNVIIEYEMDEVVKLMDEREAEGAANPHLGLSSRDNNGDYFGDGDRLTWDEAHAACRYGWDRDETLDDYDLRDIEDKLTKKVNEFQAKNFAQVYDVGGSFVDVDRYIAGDPECMVEFHQDESVLKGRALKVVVNCSAAWTNSTESMLKRGSRIVAAINAVMATGANVELWVGCAVTPSRGTDNSREGDVWVGLVQIKGFHDYIDPSVIDFALGHSDFLRRVFFFLEEEEPKHVRRGFGFGPEGSGYGCSHSFPDEIRERFDLVIESIDRQPNPDPEEIFESIVVVDDRLSDVGE